MFKFVAASYLATLALAAPNADPQLVLDHHVGAVTLPGAALPAAAHLPAVSALPANCKIEYEEIETSQCTPKTNRVCDTKELRNEGVEYKRVCKDVVSTHCGGPAHHFLAKREADAQFLGGYAGHPIVAPAAATVTATIKHECTEVTEKHCVDNPQKVENTVPVERCHVETFVDCEPVVQKIPKTVCEPVETKVVTHHAAGLFHL